MTPVSAVAVADPNQTAGSSRHRAQTNPTNFDRMRFPPWKCQIALLTFEMLLRPPDAQRYRHGVGTGVVVVVVVGASGVDVEVVESADGDGATDDDGFCVVVVVVTDEVPGVVDSVAEVADSADSDADGVVDS